MKEKSEEERYRIVDRHMEALLDETMKACSSAKTPEERRAAKREFNMTVNMMKIRYK